MSQLQWGLLVLGGVVLVAMVAYNAWLEHKNRPRQPLPTESADLGFAGQEPTLDVTAFDADPFVMPVAPEKKPVLDALIDALVLIVLDAAVSGDAVLAAMPPTRRIGSKPFAVEGLNLASDLWEPVQAGQRYSQLQAGLQLANRGGPINDIEFSEFVVKTQSFCDTLNGTPDFPDMRQEVSRARELDQFAGDHDAQLGFVLRARQTAWSPSYIQQLAARQGFVAGSMAGRMVLPASQTGLAPVLSLTFDTQTALADDPTQTALRELILGLDVAQVARHERAFERLRDVAANLAREMDGVVTDDNGVALPSAAMDVIAADLERLYDALEQHGITAGSPLARRLFS